MRQARLIAAELWRSFPRVGLRAAQGYFLLLALACTGSAVAIMFAESGPTARHGIGIAIVVGVVAVRIGEYRRRGPFPLPVDLAEIAVLAVLVTVEGVQPVRAIVFPVLMYRAVIAALPRIIALQAGFLAVLTIGAVRNGATGLPADVLGLTLMPYTLFLLRSLLQAGEREREHQHRLLRTLMQNLPTGVIVADLAGRLTLVNQATRRLLHWTGGDKDGPPATWNLPLATVDGAEVADADHPLARALAGQPCADAEFSIATGTGGSRRVILNADPLIDSHGEQLGAVVTLHDVTQQRHQQQELTQLTLYDRLTGVANRELLAQRLTDQLATSRGKHAALLLVGLDRFKTVNEALGHRAGDEVLMVAASRITESVSAPDTVARVGGDEFAVLLNGDGRERAESTAARIITQLNQPIWVGEHPVRCGASVGVVTLDRPATADELLHDAELALLDAKNSGGARAHRFTSRLRTDTHRRMGLVDDLHHAVDRDQLRVFYQPIIDLATDRPRSVEALVRWEHPQLGLVSPDRFIPLAESTGVIADIGQFVLRHSCHHLATATGPGAQLDLSVNVAPTQLQDPHFAEAVLSVLELTGLAPGRLVLEITESAPIEGGQALPALNALRAHGVRIAVDDFGTGYSSLARLDGLPVDILKIDRSLLAKVGGGERAPLIDAAIALAHGLGLHAVAEGVETTDQADYLRRLRCDSAQGFLFARPAPWTQQPWVTADAAPAGFRSGGRGRAS